MSNSYVRMILLIIITDDDKYQNLIISGWIDFFFFEACKINSFFGVCGQW